MLLYSVLTATLSLIFVNPNNLILQNCINSNCLFVTHIISQTDTSAISLQNTIENPYKNYLASIPSILPLKNLNRKYMISSFYKKRLHPVEQTIKMHNGVDIAAPTGTPVHATADGIIIKIFQNNSSIGYAIKIKHAHHYQTLYGHLNSLPNCQVGWEVKRGQIIGYVGSTGLSTAPHLHYCVYYRAMPINPYQYLNLLK
jgi:murein DD-endopeptidase MepM/ murein hydrolase activator NlpD